MKILMYIRLIYLFFIMKKYSYWGCIAISFLIYTGNVYGQVTLTQTDMPQAGMTITLDSDLSPGVSQGNAGASQSWDFTGLHATKTQTIDFETSSSTPYSGSFPSANLADSMVGYPGYNYFSSQSSSFSIVGGMPIIQGFQVTIHFNPFYQQLALPGVYNNTDGGTTRGISNSVPFSYVGSDSAKGTITITYTDTMDAWGTMQMPFGSYSVLRQKHYELDIDTLFLYYSYNTPHWTPVQEQITKMHQYRWYAKNIGYMLAQMQMDSTNTHPISVAWYASPEGINEVTNHAVTVVYPNPCVTQANFFTANKNAAAIVVYDITGHRMAEAAIKNGEASVNTSWFARGIYLFKTTTLTGAVVGRGKFAVQ